MSQAWGDGYLGSHALSGVLIIGRLFWWPAKL